MSVPDYRNNYRLTFLASLSGVLVLCIALVEWWPVTSDSSLQVDRPTEEETIPIEAVTTTRQSSPPPPPPPASVAPPVSVPEDVTLSEEPLDLEVTWQSPSPAEGAEPYGSGGDSVGTVFSKTPPQPIHFAEPNYPPAAWEEGIYAQIVVEVTVDRHGRAETRRITDRYLIERGTSNRSVSAACCSQEIMERELVKTSDRLRVSHLGHGLEEAALGAAWKWQFKPPSEDGKTLASSAVLTFTFGR